LLTAGNARPNAARAANVRTILRMSVFSSGCVQ